MTAALPPGDAPPAGSAERRRALLEARARAIAEAREAPGIAGIPVLAFRLEGRPFGVEVAAVGQVLEARGLWPLPASPPWLIGAIVARTRIVPVLDLRPMLGLAGEAHGALRRVIVIERGSEAWALGVERLDGRRDVAPEQVAAPGPGPFKWATTDGLAVLDLDALEAPAGRAG